MGKGTASRLGMWQATRWGLKPGDCHGRLPLWQGKQAGLHILTVSTSIGAVRSSNTYRKYPSRTYGRCNPSYTISCHYPTCCTHCDKSCCPNHWHCMCHNRIPSRSLSRRAYNGCNCFAIWQVSIQILMQRRKEPVAKPKRSENPYIVNQNEP